MGTRRWCWLLVVFAATTAVSAEEEDKKASPLALGISTTLLLTVTFVITLMYAINHPDIDMRKHTYSTIVSTISIFCAVLIFSTCNDMLGELGNQLDFDEHKQCMVNFVHMLTWYVLMQIFLAYVCEVFGNFNKRAKTEFQKENNFKLNVKCWAQLLAHLTGFASINAWGSLQQLPYFRETAAKTLLILPAGMVGSFVLQRITDAVRTRIARMDGEVDESEETWDEEAEECEDDVQGLTLSFNAVQSIRFFVAHTLPNAEGEWEVLEIMEGGFWQVMGEIYFAGVVGAAGVVLVIALGLLVEEEEDGSESEREEGEGSEDGLEREESKALSVQIQERFIKIIVVSLSMVYAWCTFYSGQLLVARLMKLTVGFDEMSLSLALAFFLSAMSFIGIRILDDIADTFFPAGGKGYQATTKVILAIGILVGFSWEQCFDKAVASIASRTANVWGRHAVKALLALMCVGVLVPAYKKFLLPMQILKGYRHGFVVQRVGERGNEELYHAAVKVFRTLHKRMGAIKEQGAHQEHADKIEKVHKVLTRLHDAVGSCSPKASSSIVETSPVAPPGYAPLPASEAEELEKLRREIEELGSFKSENMRLSKENETFKATFRESLKVLKALQQNEEERAEGLRLHHQGMDDVLGRVRGLESRLCLNNQYRSPRL